MKRSIPMLFSIVMVLFVTLSANAAIILQDHFDNGVLDPAWSISLSNVSSWDYSESSTTLVVTDIQQSTTPNEWSVVTLNRNLPGLNDFHISLNFSWDSNETLLAMQQLYVYLYDVDNKVIGAGGYGDAWINESGVRVAQMDLAGGDRYAWTPNELALSGSASYDIIRNDIGGISYYWDGSLLLSGTETRPLSRIGISFEYWYHDGHPNDSIFGSESLDLIRVDSATAVPVPSSMLLFASALAGVAGVRWRSRKT